MPRFLVVNSGNENNGERSGSRPVPAGFSSSFQRRKAAAGGPGGLLDYATLERASKLDLLDTRKRGSDRRSLEYVTVTKGLATYNLTRLCL